MSPDLSIEARLRAAFDLSPTILAITSATDGRFLDVNDAFTRLHGYARSEVIGRKVTELDLWVDPGQRQEALRLINAGSPVRSMEARMRTKHGDEIVCLLNADLVMIEGTSCILTALTDITARVRAEEALRESQRHFLLAFHANPLPMTITSLPDGRHLEVNDAAVQHSGFPREEMLGRTKAELGFWVVPEQRAVMMQRLHERGEIRDFEVAFAIRSGERRDLLVNSQVMTFRGMPAVLSIAVDITERKELEAQSRQRREEAERLAESLRQADRAKDEFLAMLGHELRNPLGTIVNALAILDRPVDDRRKDDVLAVVSRQTSHLVRLVDDLLDISRLTSGRIALHSEPIDVRALVGRCIDALAQSGRTRHHHVSLEGESVHVVADVARLEQIVNNLLDNAVKYTPAGGRVVVRVDRDADEVVLRVRDTGRGIAADLLPRVFDSFVQAPQSLDRSRGGLGLGLAVVKRLVELHGGTVCARSAGVGLGSEFSVRLPVGAAAAATTTGPPGSTAPPGPPRRVLVVEDNADARDMLKTLLEMAGHVVETAGDGADGLEKLSAFRPDIALIDVGLPGLDGYALARMARERADTRDVRLVAVTGYGQADDQRRAMAAGFDHHLTKPVDPEVLQETISRL